MILYCADAPYLLGEVLIHCNTQRNDDKVIILGDISYYTSKGYLEVLEKLKKSSVIYDYVLCKMFFDCTKQISQEEYIDYIIEYYDNIFKSSDYNVTDFTEIICLNDGWDGFINIYFNLKEIQYTWLLVDTGHFFTKVIFRADQNNSQQYLDLMNKYMALSPFAPYATPEILEETDQNLKDSLIKPYTSWSKHDAIESIDYECLKKIVDCFDVPQIDESATMIIPNSYGYLAKGSKGVLAGKIKDLIGLSRYSQQDVFSCMHKIAMDYYLDAVGKIYFKPHPNNPISDSEVKALFGENAFLINLIPFELLQQFLILQKKKISNLIAYHSLSVKGVALSSFANTIILGESYIYNWFFYDSIYASLKIAQFLECKIVADEMISDQLKFLINREKANVSIEIHNYRKKLQIDRSIVIIDGIAMAKANKSIKQMINQYAGKSNVVAFLNVDFTDDFFEEVNNLQPIIIEKENIADVNSFNDRQEMIWIYSEKVDFLRRLDKFACNVILRARKAHMKVHCVDWNTTIDLFERQYARKLVRELQIENGILKNEIRDIITYLDNENLNIEYSFKRTRSIQEFLNVCSMYKKNIILILGVKDTPGSNMSPDIAAGLRAIGFSKFSTSTWHMYAGIVMQGKTVLEKLADKIPDAVELNTELQINDKILSVDIQSKSWKTGNECEILVNSVNYARNTRGINIVVMDCKKGAVIDSISYDCAGARLVFTHK